MKIVILDAKTLGGDIDLGVFNQFGSVDIYQTTAPSEVGRRISDADVIVVNKVKLNRGNLRGAEHLKLICVTATGYDNIDLTYCWRMEIGVCNVRAYSTDSVAQITAAMVFSLASHLREYSRWCESGDYTRSGLHNRLIPTFHEISSKTWGIVGLGNIGRAVAYIAESSGCRVIASKNSGRDSEFEVVPLDELCAAADIISVHVPLNDETLELIDSRRIAMMKKDAILVNMARGAVIDEAAVAYAIERGELGGFGCDVYSAEPFPQDHPYNRILHYDNVILTPHMAWGAYEARVRCVNEVCENIRAFFAGRKRNRVE